MKDQVDADAQRVERILDKHFQGAVYVLVVHRGDTAFTITNLERPRDARYYLRIGLKSFRWWKKEPPR